MLIGINLAAPHNYEPSIWADRTLTGGDVRLAYGTGSQAPDGWPIGKGAFFHSAYLGPQPREYNLVVTKGAASAIDVNEGAGMDGHVSTKIADGVATFTARSAGGVPFTINTTDAGETHWALVATDDLSAWRADPFAFAGDWLKPRSSFAEARFMDWLGTNSNTGPTYVDPDLSRPGAFTRSIPLSVIVAFSKQTGVAPWINIPVAISDAGLIDFIGHFEPLRALGIVPNFELGNEVWNSAPAYCGYPYAVAQEKALIAAGELPAAKQISGQRWYGYRAAQVSKIIQSLGWKVRKDFNMSLGCFTNLPGNASLVWAGVVAAGGVDADFSRWIISAYFHGDLISNVAQTVAWIKAADVASAIESIKTGKSSSLAWYAANILPAHKATADAHGLDLVVYECNLSLPSIPNLADSALTKLSAGFNSADAIGFLGKVVSDQRMGAVWTQLLQTCEAGGVDLVCAYNDQQAWGQDGLWGLYGTPGWDALMAWIAANKAPPANATSADSWAAIIADMEKLTARAAALLDAQAS